MVRSKRVFILSFILCLALLTGAGAAFAGLLPFFTAFPRIDQKKWYVSNGWANGDHQSCEWRASAVSLVRGGKLRLTLSDKGGRVRPIGCGEIQSTKRYGHGRFEARMKTAKGSGLNTAFFTYVGPPVGVKEHDEIDFEFIGTHPDTVDITVWRAGKSWGPAKRIPLGFDASADFHDYAFEWTENAVRWYADGKLIHETPPGTKIPKNPGGIYLSLWSGAGDVEEWMGPFKYEGPVTAEVEWVKFTPIR